MLTALSSTENVVTGLDSGADDYLIKPFKFAELEARIRTLIRRSKSESTPRTLITVADLEIDTTSKTATRAGKLISLTATEFRLLEFFAQNRNRVLSRIELLENVWDINFNMGTNVVDVYVNYLRKKVDNGYPVRLIHTVFGMGYVLKEEILDESPN
jgi:DNA-binding response OmpR family regulator